MRSSSLLASLCFFFFASAAPPASVFQRIDNSPGLGIELELRALPYKNPREETTPPPGGKCTPDDVKLIKGKAVKVLNSKPPTSSKNDWLLTAEHTGTEDCTGISCLVSEFIVDGTKVKVGEKRAGPIADEITKFLTTWKPSKSGKSEVQIAGFESCGSWFVEAPKEFNEGTTMQYIFQFGQQVTAAMPLEGIQALFVKAKSGKKDTLLTTVQSKLNNMHQVRMEDFSELARIKPSDINDEFLGFFSMVISYAKAGPKQAATDGPKMALPLMPRTDQQAIYTKFIRGKLGEQLKCDSLYQIVKELASYKGDGSGDKDSNFGDGSAFDKAQFKWDNGIEGKNNKHAELLVSDWMKGLQDGKGDLMAQNDKIIDGQIGGLGDRMEYLYQANHDRLVPIFEFRDLGSSNGPNLQKSLVAFEDAVVTAHKEYSKPPRKLKTRDPDIKRDDKCLATTTNKPPAQTNAPPPPSPPPAATTITS